MPNLYNFKKDDYATLLASNVLDASKGALFSAKGLEPDTTNRTILIGLGGTGVRTIDYVKGAISKRLDGAWKNYVAFLGIDASWTELDGATYLDPSECVMITKNGINARMSNEATYPAAVRRFMLEGAQLGSLGSDGCGRTRLAGKVKIHDQAPGGNGIDEDIVSKLIKLKASALEPLSPMGPGKYQVYVIGSVCGGTCSGGFLEMPALIRKAIPNQVQVNAMLYLPDTLTSLDPQWESKLYANGYASLKELNYYMGMYMRPEYAETWSYNSSADSELTHKSSIVTEGFIDVPYLIGTTNGAAADASQRAMETIAEFLISLLAKISVPDSGVFLTSAFVSNATSAASVGARLYAPGHGNTREAANEFHEFPKRFAAIGFAEASAPKKLVRAYTVGRVCDMAGLKPVKPEERTSLLAAGKGVIIPFRGEDDLLNATEGTAKAEELLTPVKQILGIIHSGNFNFGQDLNETDITWTKIKKRHYDNPAIAAKTDMVIKSRTSTEMMDTLRKRIKSAYDDYRRNVQEFVRAEGPYAFMNIYNGRFIPVGDEHGTGIGHMIQNLLDGRLLDGKPFNGWQEVENAESAKDVIDRAIADTTPGPLGIELGKHKDQCSQWVTAYNNWGRARINEKRREVTLGQYGSLHDNFQVPAAKLAQEIEAFGRVLETLTGIYQNHGKKMESYDAFKTAQDNKTEVNIAAVNSASYQWLKGQADNTLVAVNAHQLRDNLVDHFFAVGTDGIPNAQKWLDVPKNRVNEGSTGKIELTIPDVAIPAREIFDQHMAKDFPSVVDVSIETMFAQMNQAGVTYDKTAHEVINQLAVRSLPQFNGDIPENAYFRYIMYPNALKKSDKEGPAIAAAIEQAAKNIFPGIQVYASDDADSIMFYQQATPMEIYRLADLATWEKHYEQGDHGLKSPTAFLHGKSPDITVVEEPGRANMYIEHMPWKDYPAIARQTGDPTVPDSITGQVSREGKLRLELNELIQKAKNLGVLYSENTAEGWVVKRVHCSKAIQWRFDVMECQADPATGLLPLGKELAEAVANQNDRTLEFISRKVMLNLGGVMSQAHVTEEMAWEYAARTLRAHVPMYAEIRETVEKFEQWAKEIVKHNAEIMKQFLPAKMVYMLKARTLRRNDDGAWQLIMPNGTVKAVANLTPAMMKFLPPKDKTMIENGLLGYYLFEKLSAVLNRSEAAFDEAYNRSRKVLDQMANDGDIDALTAGEEKAAIVLAERDALMAKGARLDGEATEPREMFVKAMANVVSKDKLADIDQFYFRVGLWEVI